MRYFSFAILALLSACEGRPSCAEGPIPALTATAIPGSPYRSPIFLTQAPGRSDALFVVEQPGTIQIVIGDTVSEFLDVGDRITAGGEQGLLGLAFHPSYESNGRFFVYYTASDFTNVVAEYHRSASDPNVADGTEVARLIAQPDDEGNHNGGMLAFGRDGFLYVGMGDGGNGGDSGAQHAPEGNGQNLHTLFGKILRLDVDASGNGYAASGNPFSGDAGLPQIWAYGVRNPWRFSFDRATGDFWLGDVGQGAQEEIDFVRNGTAPGTNFGWRVYEGDSVYDMSLLDMGLAANATPPIFVLDRANDPLLRGASAIIGGYVYRGDAIPELRGTYLFGDDGSGDIGAMHYCPDTGALDAERVPGLESRGSALGAFGEDDSGELYLLYVGSGDVLKIEAEAAP